MLKLPPRAWVSIEQLFGNVEAGFGVPEVEARRRPHTLGFQCSNCVSAVRYRPHPCALRTSARLAVHGFARRLAGGPLTQWPQDAATDARVLVQSIICRQGLRHWRELPDAVCAGEMKPDVVLRPRGRQAGV